MRVDMNRMTRADWLNTFDFMAKIDSNLKIKLGYAAGPAASR
jgi:hypothetical protein